MVKLTTDASEIDTMEGKSRITAKISVVIRLARIVIRLAVETFLIF